jgi:hypothetical protein
MSDEIEVPIEVDAATYAYLLKQAAPRHKGAGSSRKLAKRAEDPTITQARQQMKAAVHHFLTTVATKTAAAFLESEKLAKSKDEELAALLRRVPAITWEDLVPDLAGDLKTIACAGGARALAQIEVTDRQMLSDVNEVASDWADSRAAELVGMRRLASGRLVRNPDAQWTISDKTRDDLRQIVTEAFEKKTTMKELADQIQGAGTFSEYRAHMIAATETIRSENQGNLAGWRTSGQVLELDWVLSADHDDAASDCECGDNADGDPYPIDEAPELPAHPNCTCALVVARLVGQEERGD